MYSWLRLYASVLLMLVLTLLLTLLSPSSRIIAAVGCVGDYVSRSVSPPQQLLSSVGHAPPHAIYHGEEQAVLCVAYKAGQQYPTTSPVTLSVCPLQSVLCLRKYRLFNFFGKQSLGYSVLQCW